MSVGSVKASRQGLIQIKGAIARRGWKMSDDRWSLEASKVTIISSGIDSTIKIWSVDTAKCIRVLSGHETSVRSIALTPDRQTLVSSSTDGTIRLWDLETGQTRKLLRPQRPYEDMNIADVQGLTTAQKDTLIALGARVSSSNLVQIVLDKKCHLLMAEGKKIQLYNAFIEQFMKVRKQSWERDLPSLSPRKNSALQAIHLQ